MRGDTGADVGGLANPSGALLASKVGEVRIALSSYRSKPHSGGQGIYVRHLSRELVRLGHDVTVFSGQPYPVLDDGVRLEKVPSLDLYNEANPFRHPHPRELRDRFDIAEYAGMLSGTFPEPRTFGMRLHRLLRSRIGEFDVLHDNQTLAPGILALEKLGLPVVTTIHHPISADRRLEIESASTPWQKYTKWRWYGFVPMQARVAQHSSQIITVSETSRADIEREFHVKPERMTVVPVGVDVDTFTPSTDHHPQRGTRRDASPDTAVRLTVIASSSAPLKGLDVLVDAVAKLPSELWSELVVVGEANSATAERITARGLSDRARFVKGISDNELAELLASATVHVVPSRYEGFSLPAIEAMACGTPVVATAVGALPQLINGSEGPHQCADAHLGRAGWLVRPGDSDALAEGLAEALTSGETLSQYGRNARARAEHTYSWRAVAQATVAVYERRIHDQEAAC